MAGISARRTSCMEGEADVLREETGRSTAEARRGTGPRTSTQSEEITSGRASAQQGHTAPCKDSRTTPSCRGRERVEVWRRSPEERGGLGNAGRGCGNAPRGGVTPHRGEGTLGTVMAREVTPYETLCSREYGKRSYWLAAEGTMHARGVGECARKLPRAWEGYAVRIPRHHWLPTGLGKSDRPG
jgi:hypothetical protein